MKGACAAIVIAFFLVSTGCRDAPDLFQPGETPPLGPAPYRLTFDPARDLTPTWSDSGNSILYLVERARTTHQDADTISVARIAYTIPRAGGTATKLLPTLQPSVQSASLDHVAQAPDGLVAAFDLGPLAGPVCPGTVPFCGTETGPAPRLQSATIRLRLPEATTPLDADRILSIAYDGREFDTSVSPSGLSGLHRVRLHPFQRLFNEETRVSSRVSWSPDGDRLVFSDGLRLLVWDRSSDDVTAIPGSEDGLNPAWSPAGDWIAYEWLERGSRTDTTCEHRDEGMLLCVEARRSWTVPRRMLAIVRPDGSAVRLLPATDRGLHPAWSADGSEIYFERDQMIWTVDLSGTEATPVPGTEGGREPAVSPDGTYLAFSRRDPLGGGDIWVQELP